MKKLLNFTALLCSVLFLVAPHESMTSYRNPTLLQKSMQAINTTIKTHPKKLLAALSVATLSAYPALLWYREYQEDKEMDRKEFQRVYHDTGDIFMLGYRKFCNTQPSAGMTREAWYKQKLREQEEYLKSQIVHLLKITPQEFVQYEKQAEKDVQKKENQLYANKKNICGTWLKDYQNGKIVRYEGKPTKDTFTITDADIARTKQTLQGFGYKGKIATVEIAPNSNDMLAAFNSLITVRQTFFLGDHTDQAYRLRHELSHIQHKDIIFERAIKNYVKSLFKKDLDLTKDVPYEEAFDHELLAKKGITLDNIGRAGDLLMKTWWGFHERRADMEALFDMKNNATFQEKIKGKPQYQGYSLSYSPASEYEEQSQIAYQKDFLDGIANDFGSSKLFRWYNNWS